MPSGRKDTDTVASFPKQSSCFACLQCGYSEEEVHERKELWEKLKYRGKWEGRRRGDNGRKSGKAGVNAVHLQDDASPEDLTVSPAGSRM